MLRSSSHRLLFCIFIVVVVAERYCYCYIVPYGLAKLFVKLSNCIVLVIRICTNLVHNCLLYIRRCVALY